MSTEIQFDNIGRLLDTRDGEPQEGGTTQTVTANVPDDSTGVFLSITALNAEEPGYLTIWDGPTRPDISNLNYWDANICNNFTVTAISASKTFYVYASGTVDIIIDQVAYVGPDVLLPPISLRITVDGDPRVTVEGERRII